MVMSKLTTLTDWPGTHPGFSISKMRQRRVIFGKRLYAVR
jgi:hypothetical protein